jgi:hypothetical protein
VYTARPIESVKQIVSTAKTAHLRTRWRPDRFFKGIIPSPRMVQIIPASPFDSKPNYHYNIPRMGLGGETCLAFVRGEFPPFKLLHWPGRSRETL